MCNDRLVPNLVEPFQHVVQGLGNECQSSKCLYVSVLFSSILYYAILYFIAPFYTVQITLVLLSPDMLFYSNVQRGSACGFYSILELPAILLHVYALDLTEGVDLAVPRSMLKFWGAFFLGVALQGLLAANRFRGDINGEDLVIHIS
jgi:hypothetical protein